MDVNLKFTRYKFSLGGELVPMGGQARQAIMRCGNLAWVGLFFSGLGGFYYITV